MRRSIVAIALAAACGGPSSTEATAPPAKPAASAASAKATPKPAPKGIDHPPEGEIVTAAIVEMNGAKYGRPAADFRAGSVTPIDVPAAKKTSRGFEVQFPSHATITTPTVYEHEVIVSGGFQGTQLYAYDATTGKERWGVDLHDDGPSSAACERGTCVVSTESCTVFAIDAETGKQKWSYWLGDPLTSAPTIAGKLAFVSYPSTTPAEGKELPPGANHVLAAFDLETGKLAWQLWLDGDVMSAPVASGEFVYVSTFAGTVIKVEQLSGKVRYAMKAKATSAPVVQFAGGVESMYYTRRADDEKQGAEEMIIRADHNEPHTKFATARKKAGYIDHAVQSHSAYNASSKSQDEHNGFGGGAPAAAAPDKALESVGVDSVSSMQGFQGSRIAHLKDRNVNTMGDEVIATDTETGAELWTYKLAGDAASQGGALGTAPVAAGSHAVLFGTLGGDILQIDPATGKQAAKYEIGGPVRSQPVVDGGWIYVGTEDGRLIAIDTKDPLVTGWPTWGANAQRTGIAIGE
jgi:outer membrane protein assembly factor BamB